MCSNTKHLTTTQTLVSSSEMNQPLSPRRSVCLLYRRLLLIWATSSRYRAAWLTVIRASDVSSCSLSRYLAGVWCFNSIREIVGTLCFTIFGCDKSTIWVFHNANSGRLPAQLLAIEAAAVQPLL